MTYQTRVFFFFFSKEILLDVRLRIWNRSVEQGKGKESYGFTYRFKRRDSFRVSTSSYTFTILVQRVVVLRFIGSSDFCPDETFLKDRVLARRPSVVVETRKTLLPCLSGPSEVFRVRGCFIVYSLSTQTIRRVVSLGYSVGCRNCLNVSPPVIPPPQVFLSRQEYYPLVRWSKVWVFNP